MILNLSSKSVIFLLSLFVLGITSSSDLAYGDTIILDASAGKTIRDSSDSNTCSNRNLSDQSTADWLNGRLYSTGTANRDCERQTGQWSLIDIPDNAIITDVDYSFTISSVTNGRACNVYPLTYDVSTATLSQLFSDARDGTPYISNNSDCLTTGSKSYDLGADADSALQSALTTTDRFGLGFTYFDEALTSVSRTTITSGSGTLVVTYTLPLPTITIDDISITEGNSGTTSATFTISRSNNLTPISLQYKTTDGTATSTDYTTVPLSTLNFAAGGSLTTTVNVTIKSDTEIESDEIFYLDLSNCIGCDIIDSQGVATITSDEPLPTITINDISITEGNSGTQNLIFTISRSDNLAPISLQYKTTDGTATSGDYNTVSLSTLTFAAGGAISRTVNVSVNGDTAIEPDEFFYLDLSNCIRCNIVDSQGIGTITSDELPAPTITVNDISITESNSGTTSATFTISRSNNLTPISLQYKTTDGTATSTDYTALPLSTLNFAAGGSLTNTVTITVNGDTAAEPDEIFYLDLSNCTGCVIADSQGMVTIINDDYAIPTITINDISFTESSSGTKNFVFTVTRSDTSAKISVKYKTSDGTATSTDYTAVPLTTINFPLGGTSLTKTVAVSINGDTAIEPNETFYLDLSNCTGCVIIDSQGIATIKNDDMSNPPPTPRPILNAMIRGDIANQQELVDMFKKYTVSNDFKYALKDPSDSVFNQLDVNKMATAGSLDGMRKLSTSQQGKATYLTYDPEWFEGGGGDTPEAEYKDYMNSVITASHYAHDNGFKFGLTPIYKDIQEYDKQFAPYVDMVILQIPHFVSYYDIAIETAVQNIKSVNPDAIVLVQLIPRDRTSEVNVDPTTIINSYKSVQDHIDGVSIFYYDSPDPVPIIEQFYQGIGIPAK